ncbi:hypothetical protein L218DRAFT_651353 [Marasmius fiardii PR-910]|nr:hypothetical protein L218DRAFT_651353 [Marasmius fiardii PR-910]
MHFSFKPAKLPKYYDQNKDPNPESVVGPNYKQRQRFKNYKHPETIQHVPEVRIRSPKVEDTIYRLPSCQNSVVSSSGSSTLPSPYEPSAAVVQLIQRHIGPGIQPNLYPKNGWELLLPFEHVGNLRYGRRSLLSEPRIDWEGDPPRMLTQPTAKSEYEWSMHPPFRGGSYSRAAYSQYATGNETPDTMSVDPVLLQGHAYENSALDVYKISSVSTSPSPSLSPNETLITLKGYANSYSSDYPATTILSAYIDPIPSLSLGSSPLQIVNLSTNISTPSGSPSRTGVITPPVPSSPIITSSPPSTVSVSISSPIPGSKAANQLFCGSSSHFISNTNSSPPRPVSRRPRTSQKRRIRSPASDSSRLSPVRGPKRLRVLG